jgi:hypothetical protein
MHLFLALRILLVAWFWYTWMEDGNVRLISTREFLRSLAIWLGAVSEGG